MLADLVLEPKFAEEDIEREKSVVMEEIRMTQDNPEDLVTLLFSQNFWNSHALGKPILGTQETVSSFTNQTLRTWFRESYAPNKLVITAAGHLTHEQLVKLAAERFSHLVPVSGTRCRSRNRSPIRILRCAPKASSSKSISLHRRQLPCLPYRSPPLRCFLAKQRPGRRDVVAAFPEYPRAVRAGLRNL